MSSNTNLDWGADYSSNVITKWVPSYWADIVRQGFTVKGETAVETTLPTDVDLSFTESSTTTDLTPITDPISGDFKSAVILGETSEASTVTDGDDWN